MMNEINELWEKLNSFEYPDVTITIEQVFQSFPTGNFKQEDDDPGDKYVYSCGESDCETGWHEYYINWKFERNKGKRSIERHTGDESGNWELSDAWEEGEDPSEILRLMSHEMIEYFKGWAEYDLDCAMAKRDILTGEKRTKKQSLQSARENIDAVLSLGKKQEEQERIEPDDELAVRYYRDEIDNYGNRL